MAKDISIEQLNAEVAHYERKALVMHKAGLIITIVGAILCALSFVFMIVSVVLLSQAAANYYNIGGVSDEQLAKLTLLVVFSASLFSIFLVLLFAGIALLIISNAVFGKKARNRKALIAKMNANVQTAEPAKEEVK
jgi:hypothetical protein